MSESLPKILVVDDVAANRVAMRSLLAKMNAEILVAASGNEALSLALDHDLAVILLDVQMPDMDGFEVAEWLRSEDRNRDVPILFVTAVCKDEFHRLQGYDAGAMDYIEKPINGRILRAKVSLLLELYNRRHALKQANQALADSLARLQRHHRELLLISRMNDRLQSCLGMEEAIQVMEESLAALFDGMDGLLLLIPVEGGDPEIAGRWGLQSEGIFPPASCAAGSTWQISAARREGCCSFASDDATPLCYCLPLWGQGQLLGFMHLRDLEPGQREPLARTEGLTTTVREAVELSLANLRMREKLKEQAVRDVLTGLFNRRYLDETLPREVSRATRLQQPLAVAMVDVDHFKRFNDTFGHDAGDRVLREVSVLLRTRLRKSDLACRYGGEELTVVMPGLDVGSAWERMETIRQEIKEIHIEHNGVALGQVSVSIGMAALPRHGAVGEDLLRKADAALYVAKQSGRDQVKVHEQPPD
ncbi:MAG: diguanylate cyclase [Magnetococcus sp. DMHC-8]